jgi:ArsR family transcriptional regulator
MLRALANPARFRIVQELARHNECIVGDLVDVLPLAQSSVSEHLKVLKEAGIVRGTVDGPNRCYCLDPAALRFLSDTFAGLEQEACCP